MVYLRLLRSGLLTLQRAGSLLLMRGDSVAVPEVVLTVPPPRRAVAVAGADRTASVPPARCVVQVPDP